VGFVIGGGGDRSANRSVSHEHISSGTKWEKHEAGVQFSSFCE